MSLHVKGTRSDVAFLLFLLATSLGFNAFLGREWWRAHKSAAGNQVAALQPDVQPGETLPPLHVKTVDGSPQTIAYPTQSQPTVLYVFTPSCPWCRRNLNNVIKLTSAKESAFRFVGISLDAKGLDSYVGEHGLKFPVYVDPSPESRQAYHLGRIPHTLVIAPGGIVLKTWRGAYKENRAEIERFFEVTLPGLSEDGDPHSQKDG